MEDLPTDFKHLSWKQLRWSYMPAHCRAYREHFTLRRLGECSLAYAALYVLHVWKAERAIQWESPAEWMACLLFAVILHPLIGLLALPTIGLRYALPLHAASISNGLGLEIGFRWDIDGVEFDRARIVIFSQKIVRLRAFAGKKSVTVGVPPDLELDLLVELLPGDVQVWDARSRDRFVVSSQPARDLPGRAASSSCRASCG